MYNEGLEMDKTPEKRFPYEPIIVSVNPEAAPLEESPLMAPTDWLNMHSVYKRDYSRFAPVAPVKILKHLKDVGMFGDYHLLLAHDVADQKNADQFSSLFLERDRGTFVIMDNSLVELGEPVDEFTMAYACELVRPNVVVLPDKLWDSAATIEMHKRAIDKWSKLGMTSFMAVLQGKNRQGILDCIKAFMDDPAIKMWAVPRVIGQDYGTRMGFIKRLRDIDPHRPIHLLGFSDNIIDDMLCAKIPGVAGIDSAVPIRAGLHKIWFGDTHDLATAKIPKRGNYWDTDPAKCDLESLSLMSQNLQYIRMLLGSR
jgi:hypothetical protein